MTLKPQPIYVVGGDGTPWSPPSPPSPKQEFVSRLLDGISCSYGSGWGGYGACPEFPAILEDAHLGGVKTGISQSIQAGDKLEVWMPGTTHIPGNSTIVGVLIVLSGSMDWLYDTSFPWLHTPGTFTLAIQLMNNHGLIGSSQSVTNTDVDPTYPRADGSEYSVGLASDLFGGATDLWGASLTPAIINSGTFGFRATTAGDIDEINQPQGVYDSYYIWDARMIVYYESVYTAAAGKLAPPIFVKDFPHLFQRREKRTGSYSGNYYGWGFKLPRGASIINVELLLSGQIRWGSDDPISFSANFSSDAWLLYLTYCVIMDSNFGFRIEVNNETPGELEICVAPFGTGGKYCDGQLAPWVCLGQGDIWNATGDEVGKLATVTFGNVEVVVTYEE